MMIERATSMEDFSFLLSVTSAKPLPMLNKENKGNGGNIKGSVS